MTLYRSKYITRKSETTRRENLNLPPAGFRGFSRIAFSGAAPARLPCLFFLVIPSFSCWLLRQQVWSPHSYFSCPSYILTTCQTMVATTNKPPRGAFLLLEGVDRCGKTTQGRLLLNKLIAAGMAATAMRFPDRTTATGTVINNYLTTAGTDLDDRAIHLLFSANRWEAVGELSRNLRAGTNVVCDRYAYSGVAFSTSKVDEVSGKQLLPMEWCQAPDRGLPAPDCVIFLDLSQEEAEKRGGYVVDSATLFV